MTLKQINEKIKLIEIAVNKADNEVAHSFKDELYEGFVEFIEKEGPLLLSEMAKLILTTKQMKFASWCA